MPVLVVQLDDGVQSSNILNLQVRVLSGSVAFNESLNLRIGAKLAGAHLQYRFGVYFIILTFFVRAATLFTVIPKVYKNIENMKSTGEKPTLKFLDRIWAVAHRMSKASWLY